MVLRLREFITVIEFRMIRSSGEVETRSAQKPSIKLLRVPDDSFIRGSPNSAQLYFPDLLQGSPLAGDPVPLEMPWTRSFPHMPGNAALHRAGSDQPGFTATSRPAPK
jgi:hypothetical protein